MENNTLTKPDASVTALQFLVFKGSDFLPRPRVYWLQHLPAYVSSFCLAFFFFNSLNPLV